MLMEIIIQKQFLMKMVKKSLEGRLEYQKEGAIKLKMEMKLQQQNYQEIQISITTMEITFLQEVQPRGLLDTILTVRLNQKITNFHQFIIKPSKKD